MPQTGGRRKGVAQKKKVIEMRSERLMTSSTPCQMSGCIPTAQPAASGMGYLTPPPLWAYNWPSAASSVTTIVTAPYATIESRWSRIPLWYPWGYIDTKIYSGAVGHPLGSALSASLGHGP